MKPDFGMSQVKNVNFDAACDRFKGFVELAEIKAGLDKETMFSFEF